MKITLLSLTVVANLFAVNASAQYRHTCTGKCVTFQKSGDIATVQGVYTLSPATSNYSEASARDLLDAECARRAEGDEYLVVRRVLQYKTQQSQSSANHTETTTAESSKRQSKWFFYYSVRKRENSASRTQKQSVEQSSSHGTEIRFSDEEVKCSFDAQVPASHVPDYVGQDRVGG